MKASSGSGEWPRVNTTGLCFFIFRLVDHHRVFTSATWNKRQQSDARTCALPKLTRNVVTMSWISYAVLWSVMRLRIALVVFPVHNALRKKENSRPRTDSRGG